MNGPFCLLAIACISATPAVAAQGTLTVSPTQTTTYQLTAKNAVGQQNATATVVVNRNGSPSATVLVNIGVAPGIFSFPPGAGYAIAINADGSLAAPAGAIPGIATHAAKAGDALIVYATGLGPVDSPIDNGAN